MTAELRFDQIRLPPACEALRAEVRSFIAQEVAAGTFDPDRPDHGDLHHLAFSRRVGFKSDKLSDLRQWAPLGAPTA
jgi:hypothetical protein